MRFIGLVVIEAAGFVLGTGLLIGLTEGWSAVRHPVRLGDYDSAEPLKDDLIHLVFIVALVVLPLSLLALFALMLVRAR